MYSEIVGNAFIDIDQAFSSGDFLGDWEAPAMILKVDPLVVASFVFDSVKYDRHLENVSLERLLRRRLSDLLQFSTPIRSRHLVSIRISEEFVQCHRGLSYPTRLVPQ